MATKKDLKPCPYCGGTYDKTLKIEDNNSVQCEKCTGIGPSVAAVLPWTRYRSMSATERKDGAIALWNARTPAAMQAVLVSLGSLRSTVTGVDTTAEPVTWGECVVAKKTFVLGVHYALRNLGEVKGEDMVSATDDAGTPHELPSRCFKVETA